MYFDINETIKKLDELEQLALTPNEKGDINISLAVKIEELKAKFAQMRIDNDFENKYVLNVTVKNQHQKKIIEEI